MHNYVYYNPLHVSSNSVLIISGSNCINAASVIVVSLRDHLVCRLRRKVGVQVEKELQFLLNLHTGRSLTDSAIPDAVFIQFDLLMMSTVLLETCERL